MIHIILPRGYTKYNYLFLSQGPVQTFPSVQEFACVLVKNDWGLPVLIAIMGNAVCIVKDYRLELLSEMRHACTTEMPEPRSFPAVELQIYKQESFDEYVRRERFIDHGPTPLKKHNANFTSKSLQAPRKDYTKNRK